MTKTLCCIKHDYTHTHIQRIYHILCTHKRHPIPHPHEWVNNVLFIRDSSENTDHGINRLDITIRFAGFGLSWIYGCYTSLASAKGACLNICVCVRCVCVCVCVCACVRACVCVCRNELNIEVLWCLKRLNQTPDLEQSWTVNMINGRSQGHNRDTDDEPIIGRMQVLSSDIYW